MGPGPIREGSDYMTKGGGTADFLLDGLDGGPEKKKISPSRAAKRGRGRRKSGKANSTNRVKI